MNNSLVTLCIVFSLFYLTSAYSKQTKIQIYVQIVNLTNTFKKMDCNSTLVPILGETKNVSAAEICCRAMNSLEKVCLRGKEHLQKLERLLHFVKAQAKPTNQTVKCDVSEDEEDIISFLRSLRSYFQYQILNYKP